ncbi:MAG TPA: tRNA (adenosine(37)-N6)-threonylcarbamoyltransferase complex dimerization subunit type 1 TsaB [Candidatus Omnitrophota bacterium]|nr:tRNA (adenosine(37)-N6)-threonylcarbamoyltransferase complex dimerization subunit type 1 TsaB [Candidatus Omnitrophota bacterium]HOX09059.1 tRNA (adenosine(37)-N6)-threonylcarbamoyltransferase complex dimerization subunit type 1 TsaB [Candidatus Omnitrophota bacterium]HPN66339.1 tRNA (adenosine(37)-N6)-threonylcarbamoyltransferase complex dimerization subunit type 1 TsaB [Candidatus Omnitrophota bacterium]
MTKILALDTSSKYISAAIADGSGKIIASAHKEADQMQCERLLPEIDKLLKKAKLQIADIGIIIFSKGPGSLTSLRIGAAAVKGLAFTRKIKIVGVPTLDVIARCLPIIPSLAVPMVDARRGNVYCSIYSRRGGKLSRKMKYSVIPVAELLKSVKGDTIFTGDGLAAYGQYIRDNFKFKAEFAPERYWYPSAEVVLELGLGLIKKKKFEDTDKFTPLYVYPKDVQVR